MKRYRVSITYAVASDELSTVVTFETAEWDVAVEAYRLTKVPVGGFVQLESTDDSPRGEHWTELGRK